jgi:hypothetical protein
LIKKANLAHQIARAGSRVPVSGPEKAWVVPSTSVDRLADSLGTPAQLQARYRVVDVMNVDTAVLHGVFTAAELKDILERMKALGKSR